MPNRLELLIEAHRRGILPPEKKPLFDEAVKRGLIRIETPERKFTPDNIAARIAGHPEADRLIRTGVTPGNYHEFAQADYEARVNRGEAVDGTLRTALFDAYRQMAGLAPRQDTTYQDHLRMDREAKQETVAGRFLTAGQAAFTNFGRIGTSALGIVAPETAQGLREEYETWMNPDLEARSGQAGNLAAEIAKLVALRGVTGAGGMGTFYGTQGFGDTRVDAAARRREGQDVGLGAELGTAAGVGAAEGLAGYVSGLLYDRLGPLLKGAVGRMSTREMVRQAATLIGGAFAEGAEEAVTQLVTNKITQMGMDPDQAVTEGLAEAFVVGAILAPFGMGQQRQSQRLFSRGESQAQQVVGDPQDAVVPVAEQPVVAEGTAPAEVQQPVVAEGTAPVEVQQPAPVESTIPETVDPSRQDRVFRPPLPDTPMTQREKLAWARDHGYDVSGLENKGHRIIDAALARQQEDTVSRHWRMARDAPLQQKQLPANSTGWDAGRLRRFAKENAYEIDERRVQYMVERWGMRPRQAVRALIEEQYALPPGQGPEGEVPRRGKQSRPESEPPAPPQTPTGDSPRSKQPDAALAESDARMAREKAQRQRQRQERQTPADDSPSQQDTDAEPAAGLPRIPAAAREWSFTKLKNWAREQGYQVGKLHNLNALRRGIGKQRRQSLIKLPPVPKASRKWNFRRFKWWADKNGYNVEGVTTRRELRQAIEKQRKQALRIAIRKPKRVIDPKTDKDRRIQELEAEVDRLFKEARQDPLTGLDNRRAMDEAGERLQQRSDETGKPYAVIALDAANLKSVNDKLGETEGNKYLKKVADVIRKVTRAGDETRLGDAFRYGGDEYAVLIPDANEAEAAAIRDRIEQEFGKMPVVPGVSAFIVGDVAAYTPGSGESMGGVLQRASERMKARKTAQKEAAGEATTREAAEAAVARQIHGGMPKPEARATIKRARESAAKGLRGWLGRVVRGEARIPREVDEIIAPIDNRIRDLAPRVYRSMLRFEYRSGRDRERAARRLVKVFSRLSKSLGGKKSEKYRQFHLAVSNQDFDAARALLPKDRHADLDAVTRLTEQLHRAMVDAGVSVGRLDNFWKRYVKDYEGLKAEFGDQMGIFEEAWALRRQAEGKTVLTAEEKVETANRVLQGYGPRKIGNMGSPITRERKIDKLTDAQLDYYLDPFEAMLRYVNEATYLIHKSRWMGKNVFSDVSESVGQYITEAVERGELDAKAQSEVRDLLTTRLLGDMVSIPKYVRVARQAVFAAVLSQVRSAVTQVLDIGISVAHHGPKATMAGLAKAVRLSQGEKRLVMESLGIHEHGAEFIDAGKMAKVTSEVLKWTGFRLLDRIGKETRINAAEHNFRNLARNPESRHFKRLERDWKPVFGEKDWAKLVADLRAGRRSQLTGELVFMDLTQVQPVMMSGMPAQYLKMGKGRIMYALQSFTLRQADMVRRRVFRKLATPGQRLEGLEELGKLVLWMSLVGLGKEFIQDMLRGKMPKPEDVPEHVIETLLGVIGLNRYAIDQGKTTPFRTAMDQLAPPLSWIDNFWQDGRHAIRLMTGADDEFKGMRATANMPVIGDLLHFWTPLGRGYYMNREEANREYREKLKELRTDIAQQVMSGNYAEAETMLRAYNERRQDGPGDGRKRPLRLRDIQADIRRAEIDD